MEKTKQIILEKIIKLLESAFDDDGLYNKTVNYCVSNKCRCIAYLEIDEDGNIYTHIKKLSKTDNITDFFNNADYYYYPLFLLTYNEDMEKAKKDYLYTITNDIKDIKEELYGLDETDEPPHNCLSCKNYTEKSNGISSCAFWSIFFKQLQESQEDADDDDLLLDKDAEFNCPNYIKKNEEDNNVLL